MMKNPPHPGEIMNEECLVPLGLTVTGAAEWLGVPRETLSDIVAGRSGLSADIALRLEKAGWSSAEMWVGVQVDYDLARARLREGEIDVKPYPQAQPA